MGSNCRPCIPLTSHPLFSDTFVFCMAWVQLGTFSNFTPEEVKCSLVGAEFCRGWTGYQVKACCMLMWANSVYTADISTETHWGMQKKLSNDDDDDDGNWRVRRDDDDLSSNAIPSNQTLPRVGRGNKQVACCTSRNPVHSQLRMRRKDGRGSPRCPPSHLGSGVLWKHATRLASQVGRMTNTRMIGVMFTMGVQEVFTPAR